MNLSMSEVNGIYGTYSARPMLDWMFEGGSRTPQEYPYSYDAHYLWRTFSDPRDVPPSDTVYTDRMIQWDREKYVKATNKDDTDAFGKLGNLGSWGLRWSEKQASIITQRYFGAGHMAIGYGLCANQSNGYEIGIILVQSPEQRGLTT